VLTSRSGHGGEEVVTRRGSEAGAEQGMQNRDGGVEGAVKM
jgi:hypothetical protein